MGNKLKRLKEKKKESEEKEKENAIKANITGSTCIANITPKTSNKNLIKIDENKLIAGSLQQDIRKLYKFKEVLGGGHFGTVRVAYKRDGDPTKLFAIKSISKKNLSEKDLTDLINEVGIISNLDHPNIIKFFETYHDEYYFHIVMELCQGKEVFDKISQEKSLTENFVAKIIYKVLSAINYCHSNGISHRDIKPENILFESTNPNSDIKIIDFGLSRKYDSNEKMHTILGTPYYVAPEVLKGDYDQKCDIWSLGAITYVMLCGEPPFRGDTNSEIFKKIMNDDLCFDKSKWKNISSEAKDFIELCMRKKPEKRINAEDAFFHPWFKAIEDKINSMELDSDILINIRNFSSPQIFKKMILKYITNFLSSEEIKTLKKTFYTMDIDHTGRINMDELGKAFKDAGIFVGEEELKRIIAFNGCSDCGKIDYSDFIVASLDYKAFINKEMLTTAFKYFDVDSSGYIDSSDVKKAMLRSGKEITDDQVVDKIMEEVSTKEFGKLSLEDFIKMFELDK